MDTFRDVLIPQAAVLAYLAICALLGLAALRKLALADADGSASGNPWLRGFFALSLGLVLSIATLFVLGLLGCLTPAWVATAHASMLAPAAWILAKGPLPDRQAIVRCLLGPEAWLVAVLYVWCALAAIRPPGQFDDTMYHLPLARYYLEHHALLVQPFLRFPFFPQNMELLFVLGLMAGSDVAAQALATLPLFVMAIGMIGASVWLLGSMLPGFAATLLMLSLAPVRYTLGYAYVDHGLALFCWGAFLALALWEGTDRTQRRWLLVAGILAGGAMGSKYFGAVPAAMIGAWILIGRRDWKGALCYGGTAFVFGAGWYLRSWILSGDPVHPAGGPLFGYYLWNAQDLAGQVRDQARYGVARQITSLWPALKEARFAEWGMALAWILFAWRSSRPLRLLYGFFLAYLLFWVYVTQLPRYLAPVYALGCLFSVATLIEILRLFAWPARRSGWHWRDAWPVPVVCLALAAYQLLPASRAAQWRMAHWQETLDQQRGHALYQRANTLMPRFGDRVFQVGFENGVYFFHGIVFGDWFGPSRYSQSMDCSQGCRMRPPEVVIAGMKQYGVRMLMVNTRTFRIDMASYNRDFDLQLQTPQGVLLTLK